MSSCEYAISVKQTETFVSSQHVRISLIEVNSQDASIPLTVNFQVAPSPWELAAGQQRILNSVLVINYNLLIIMLKHYTPHINILLFTYCFKIFICSYVCKYVHVCAYRSQERALDPLELELELVRSVEPPNVGHKNKTQSSLRAVSASNIRIIPSAPTF